MDRREVSWLPSLPPAPSRLSPVAARTAPARGFLGDSGGTAPDSHRTSLTTDPYSVVAGNLAEVLDAADGGALASAERGTTIQVGDPIYLKFEWVAADPPPHRASTLRGKRIGGQGSPV
jgi:hypothetical protein